MNDPTQACRRYSDAGIIAPFDDTSLLGTFGFGLLVFDEAPGIRALIRAGVVGAGGVPVIWRKHQFGIERTRTKAAKGEAI